MLDTGLVVVIDEAYYEFSGQTVAGLIREFENLVVLRTLSKWAGLAGLRIGYGIMNSGLVDHIIDIKSPYNINVAAEAAALASLEDADFLLGNVGKIVESRGILFDELNAIDCVNPWPSSGNYILCQMDEPGQAQTIVDGLASRGIFVRSFFVPQASRPLQGSRRHTQRERGFPQHRPGLCGMNTLLRAFHVERNTTETQISVEINIDGAGDYSVDAENGMFEHLLAQLARHGLFDLKISAKGDTETGLHHLVEDSGIVLGQAIFQAMGDGAGIRRAAHAFMPLDEALAFTAVDFGGRGYSVIDAEIGDGDFKRPARRSDTTFPGIACSEGKFNLHVRLISGVNNHHKAEAIFKSLARSLRAALEIDPRRAGQIPSTKGTITG